VNSYRQDWNRGFWQAKADLDQGGCKIRYKTPSPGFQAGYAARVELAEFQCQRNADGIFDDADAFFDDADLAWESFGNARAEK
jgi:hypothetical protein